jgi:hypothetical protein
MRAAERCFAKRQAGQATVDHAQAARGERGHVQRDEPRPAFTANRFPSTSGFPAPTRHTSGASRRDSRNIRQRHDSRRRGGRRFARRAGAGGRTRHLQYLPGIRLRRLICPSRSVGKDAVLRAWPCRPPAGLFLRQNNPGMSRRTRSSVGELICANWWAYARPTLK